MTDPIVLEIETLLEAVTCPFCNSDDIEPMMTDETDTECVAICECCLAQGPVATLGCRDPEEEIVDLEREAIELWNKRTSEE
jgi:transcription elongation factor Elf1